MQQQSKGKWHTKGACIQLMCGHATPLEPPSWVVNYLLEAVNLLCRAFSWCEDVAIQPHTRPGVRKQVFCRHLVWQSA